MADWITTEEAVRVSGYNVQHIRTLIRQGRVTAEKKGGQYWVDRRSLLAYMEESSGSEDGRRGAKHQPQPPDSSPK